MTSSTSGDPSRGASGRERVLDAAYELFSRSGVQATGVDRVIAEAGVAKMTLYRNFPTKGDLALAFLAQREERWTRGWLQAEVERRTGDPAGRLLAIFDVFGEWFEREDFEGCAFVSILLATDDPTSPIRHACVRHLENIRGFLRGLAAEAGAPDPDALARQWHILMKGSIVSAGEGDRLAAARAQEMGELLLRDRGVIG
jgi:AcrR family transcriptional regulator